MSSRAWTLALALSLAGGASDAARSQGAPPASLPVGSTVLLTRDEALALAFPECEVTRGTRYLSEADRASVTALAGTSFDAAVVNPYVATKAGALVGTAYFDVHKVRTLRETLMVVVGADGKLARVEVLSFGEPREYLPRAKWYGQFAGRALDDELRLKRAIRPVSGATLTASATTDCARRVLALHQTLARLEREAREAEARRARRSRRHAARARPQPAPQPDARATPEPTPAPTPKPAPAPKPAPKPAPTPDPAPRR
ncbi:MAG: FMN-binding protein [Planctomycetes bacterium]|nr:FMN-binding protein [Planctomycetota bacterium]